jgi:hypothetical protein
MVPEIANDWPGGVGGCDWGGVTCCAAVPAHPVAKTAAIASTVNKNRPVTS